MSTAIVEVQNAVAEFDKVAEGIAELRKRYSGVVFDVRTSKGMDEAKKARQEIRTPRYEIERLRKDAKAAGLVRLRELHTAAVAHEAEQERIKAEREELAKLRAEAEKHAAAERARLEEEERKARVEREAEAARQAEELRLERARLEEEQRAAREKQEAEAAAERKRIADEEAKARAIREEEARKLAEERAEFERQQEAARIQSEQEEADARERARLAALTKPSDDEIIAVLAAHYRAPESMVAGWLSQMNLSEAA